MFLGFLRLLIGLPLLILSCILVLLFAGVPVEIKGLRVGQWLVTLAARFLMPIFNVRLKCNAEHKAALRQHSGFVFANHSSFVDVFCMVHLTPMRFLGAAEYLAIPFLGWAAKALGTLPVHRGSLRARAESLLALGKVGNYMPPFSLFPEGVIGPLFQLQPFYHGAFKICIENKISYAVCAIVYEHVDIAGWRNESLPKAIWRLVSAPAVQNVTVKLLQTVHPNPQDSPRQLATQAHQAIAAALGYAPNMP